MPNFAHKNRKALAERHYVKLSVIENHWTRIAKRKLDSYIRRFGDGFNIVLITEPEATDGYLVIPYAEIKHCLTDATLENSSDRGRSPGWNMFTHHDRLRITNSDDMFSVAAFHAEQWQGVVEKASGRATLSPIRIGAVYRRADENPVGPSRVPFAVDPVKVDRGSRGHATTQNALADYLRGRRIEPRSPAPGEPEFDLAWEDGDVTFVAEVKSITDMNEERQLRLGLGQVLRYRQQLCAGGRRVVAVLVAEREASDPSWPELSRDLGVLLVSPSNFGRHLVGRSRRRPDRSETAKKKPGRSSGSPPTRPSRAR